MVGGKQVEEAIADPRLFLVDDGITRAVDENLWLNHPGERYDSSIEFQSVGHAQRIGMAGDRDNVFCSKHLRLFKNFAAHFRECETVRRRIEILETAGVLNGLQGDAPNARLLQSE